MMKTKLHDIRNKKGFSQEEFASLVNMTQSNYSRKESGFTKVSKQEWELFAKKLDVPIGEIFEEEKQTIIYKKIKSNSFNTGTINIDIPDFVMNYIDMLQIENKDLKEKLNQKEGEK